MLVTGDEVLRGAIQERDAALVARSLEPRGVAVDQVRIVGDDLGAIAGAVAELLEAGIALVCVTGGLGPTHDDLTMEAVARATGRPLALDRAALEMVVARTRGLAIDPALRRAVDEKQASLPAGALALAPAGTAAGCVLEHAGAVVVVLPGPPWELEAMWEDALATPPLRALLARAGRPASRVLRIFGVPESEAVAAFATLPREDWERLRVGICAKDAELEVTARADPADRDAIDALEGALREAFGGRLYSADGATVDEVVAAALRAAGQSVAVAESCTGGGLGARLSALPGSSAYLLGGVIAYADEVKVGQLGVDPAILAAHGAVSAEGARAMAAGARERLGSDWALSITGVAGPGGGSPEKPVGLVYIGLAGPGGEPSAREYRLRGDRATVRQRAAALALHLLRRALRPA